MLYQKSRKYNILLKALLFLFNPKYLSLSPSVKILSSFSGPSQMPHFARSFFFFSNSTLMPNSHHALLITIATHNLLPFKSYWMGLAGWLSQLTI